MSRLEYRQGVRLHVNYFSKRLLYCTLLRFVRAAVMLNREKCAPALLVISLGFRVNNQTAHLPQPYHGTIWYGTIPYRTTTIQLRIPYEYVKVSKMTVGVEMRFRVPTKGEPEPQEHHVKVEASSVTPEDVAAGWQGGEPPKVGRFSLALFSTLIHLPGLQYS